MKHLINNGQVIAWGDIRQLDDEDVFAVYDDRDVEMQRIPFGALGTYSLVDAAAPPALDPVAKDEFAWLEFLDLFTPAEQLAAAAAGRQSDAIFLWWHKASGAGTINRHDQLTIDGMAVMLAAGIVTQQRHDRIMSGLPPV